MLKQKCFIKGNLKRSDLNFYTRFMSTCPNFVHCPKTMEHITGGSLSSNTSDTS